MYQNLSRVIRKRPDEAIYAEVSHREGLGADDRSICTLAALTVLGRERELSNRIDEALGAGLSGAAIAEVFLQCGLYAGFGVTQQALAAAEPMFAAAGVRLPPDDDREVSRDALDEAARAFARELHGPRSTADYSDPDDASTRDLYAIAQRWGYGVIWQRPGLSRRQRLLCALASFTALGFDAQLRKFAASALETELGAIEVREAIMQTAPHCGFPRALAALSVLKGARLLGS